METQPPGSETESTDQLPQLEQFQASLSKQSSTEQNQSDSETAESSEERGKTKEQRKTTLRNRRSLQRNGSSFDGNGTDEEKEERSADEKVHTDEEEYGTDEDSFTDEEPSSNVNQKSQPSEESKLEEKPKKAEETKRTRRDSIKGKRPEPTELMGVTDEGETFILPKTKNPLTMYPINKWSAFDWIQNAAGLQILWLFIGMPKWFYVFNFLFWRLAYNLGLGILLHKQSKSKFLTRNFASLKGTPLYQTAGKILSIGMGPDYDFEKMPSAFNTWMAFRRLVDIVLANDLSCYVVMCLACWEFPEQFTFSVFLSYVVGLGLSVFALWAKTDSYRVVKDFAWYWGDFFFLVDQKLTFDRVFSLSPHPMYTLGYAFFYGSSLITQSNTVLLASLVGHFCQLAFLQFVENPHIEKTYPGTVEEPNAESTKILTDYFRRDLIVFKNLDVFRSSDLFLLVILFYCLVLNVINLHWTFYVGQILVWRAIHSGVLGYILHQQSRKRFWTNHFSKLGYSKQYAFENWKRIYNMSLVMTHTVFFTGTMKFIEFNFEAYGFYVVLRIVAGLILIGINLYSSVSTFEVLGEFGWFYGDFFIDELPQKIYYTGIYRYLNNPDNVTGFAAYYGCALLSGSWVIFGLALLSQLANILFHQRVERPHMKVLYGNQMRKKSGIEEALTQMFKEALESNPKLKELSQSAERISSELNSKARVEAQKLMQNVKKLRKSIRDASKVEKKN